MYTMLIINEYKVLNFKCPFSFPWKATIKLCVGNYRSLKLSADIKAHINSPVCPTMDADMPYNKLVYGNSSLWCCATAGARNYATPPPVLRAITGSASPLSLSAPAANLTPASSQVRRSTRYDAWSGLYFIDLFFDASSKLSGPVFIFSGSVCGDTVMQDRRLVVNAHPGFSKRADNRTWRRVDISVNSFRH